MMEMHTGRPKRTREEVTAEPYLCTSCGWEGTEGERGWIVRRGHGSSGFSCPRCKEVTTKRIEVVAPEVDSVVPATVPLESEVLKAMRGAIEDCLDALVAAFGHDANNMPDKLYDSYMTVRLWSDAQSKESNE